MSSNGGDQFSVTGAFVTRIHVWLCQPPECVPSAQKWLLKKEMQDETSLTFRSLQCDRGPGSGWFTVSFSSLHSVPAPRGALGRPDRAGPGRWCRLPAVRAGLPRAAAARAAGSETAPPLSGLSPGSLSLLVLFDRWSQPPPIRPPQRRLWAS